MCIARRASLQRRLFQAAAEQECAHVRRRTSVDKNTRGVMRLGTRADISPRCTSAESEQERERERERDDRAQRRVSRSRPIAVHTRAKCNPARGKKTAMMRKSETNEKFTNPTWKNGNVYATEEERDNGA